MRNKFLLTLHLYILQMQNVGTTQSHNPTECDEDRHIFQKFSSMSQKTCHIGDISQPFWTKQALYTRIVCKEDFPLKFGTFQHSFRYVLKHHVFATLRFHNAHQLTINSCKRMSEGWICTNNGESIFLYYFNIILWCSTRPKISIDEWVVNFSQKDRKISMLKDRFL